MTVETIPGRVTHIRIDDLRTRNALGLNTVRELTRSMRKYGHAETTRAVVISGTHGTFSSGGNIKEDVAAEDIVAAVSDLFDAIKHCPAPVLARVEGACLGLAVGLIAACDLVIAAEDARFALPEPRMGQVATLAAVTVVPRLRVADANRLLLTAVEFDTAEAVELGLVNAGVPGERLAVEQQHWVDLLTANGPTALAITKRLIRDIPTMTTKHAMEMAGYLTIEIARSTEAREGRQASSEHRAPVWTGPTYKTTDPRDNDD